MKNYACFLLCFTCLSGMHFSLMAQEELHFDQGCNFLHGRTAGEYTLFEPTKAADKMVDDILAVFAINPRPFILKAADVDNAQATIKGRDRYLLYSNSFLNKSSIDAQTRWAAIGIFAHEIAHHVLLQDFAETDPKKRRVNELAADIWAARIMARMGANLEEALAAVKTIQSADETNFYPTPAARRQGMESAWADEFDKLSVENKIENAGKRRPLSIDPTSFNRWNIVRASAVTAYYDEEKVTIDIALPQIYFNSTFNLILCSNDPNMPVRTVRGIGANQPYTSSKQIIWNYLNDGVTPNNAGRTAQLKVLVYASDNLPSVVLNKKAIAGWSVMSLAGVGTAVYGEIARRQAKNDYEINYTKTRLEEDYQRADKKHERSKYISIGGGFLALTGGFLITRHIRQRKSALEAICMEPQGRFEPTLIAGLPGIAYKRSF